MKIVTAFTTADLHMEILLFFSFTNCISNDIVTMLPSLDVDIKALCKLHLFSCVVYLKVPISGLIQSEARPSASKNVCDRFRNRAIAHHLRYSKICSVHKLHGKLFQALEKTNPKGNVIIFWKYERVQGNERIRIYWQRFQICVKT